MSRAVSESPRTGAPSWDALYAFAESQAGYFTTAQGAEAGYSPQLLYKHLRAGRMRRARRGIYRLVHFPTSDREYLVEHWLWAQRAGVYSHETALFLHDLCDKLPKRACLLVPESWRARRLRVPEGLALRYGLIDEIERGWLGPIPLTRPARTIRDLVDARFSPARIEFALAQARSRGLVTPGEFEQLGARLHRSLND